jgi:hypothetical protein
MKRVKTHKGYVIYEQSNKEIEQNIHGSSCKYLLYTPDEMEQPAGMRYFDFEADNVSELIDFIG